MRCFSAWQFAPLWAKRSSARTVALWIAPQTAAFRSKRQRPFVPAELGNRKVESGHESPDGHEGPRVGLAQADRAVSGTRTAFGECGRADHPLAFADCAHDSRPALDFIPAPDRPTGCEEVVLAPPRRRCGRNKAEDHQPLILGTATLMASLARHGLSRSRGAISMRRDNLDAHSRGGKIGRAHV